MFLFVNFSCWPNLHVNIVNGSRVMTISVYKALTKKSGIAKKLVRILPNIWRLELISDTKISLNILNKKLLNAAKLKFLFFLSY